MRPIVSQVAEELYDILSPLAFDDEALNWPLLTFCEAWVGSLQLIRDYVYGAGHGPDNPSGETNWSSLLDIDRCPDEALAWLAMLLGAKLPERDTFEGDQPDPNYFDKVRKYISSQSEFRQGSPQAMIAAAQYHLTGTKTVILRERLGGPWKITVHTRTDETSDTAKVLNALMAHKPAGISLTYTTIDGQDYQELLESYATYQLVLNDYATYQDVLTDTP